MKLVTFSRNKSVSCGILTDEGLIDIPAAWKGPNPLRSVKEILKKGPSCFAELAVLAESADNLTPLDSVKLLAPIPRPGKLLALAGNYAKHLKEVGRRIGMSDSPRQTTTPRPFIMPATAVIGPDEEIPWPAYSKTIDYEIELAVVIGRKAKCVSIEDAADYVGGYTIANDVSARTVTFKTNRIERPWDEFYDWLNGKWADGFLPMGPYLLTADEVEDVHNLNLALKVNGKVRQNANTEQMIYRVPDIVSFLSHLMTLEPGDIIATGTPAGVALATGDFLQPGDRIEATIEKLGTLKNTLGQSPEKFYEPLAQEPSP
ncbi:MAG: fumarylacetoacetate hydrolase family protein [Planctomycetota bacterium]|jgi:2-keto-4-pentenoate hydratase/2-oxohepta-3-ene-1,7-dioic acid hydratase in catechol pathway